jgi:hypothetical protein
MSRLMFGGRPQPVTNRKSWGDSPSKRRAIGHVLAPGSG